MVNRIEHNSCIHPFPYAFGETIRLFCWSGSPIRFDAMLCDAIAACLCAQSCSPGYETTMNEYAVPNIRDEIMMVQIAMVLLSNKPCLHQRRCEKCPYR